jgi:3-hydroxybutyryl-CoA dehydratase
VNSIYPAQDLKFAAPVKIGDTITVVVTGKRDDKRIIKLRTTTSNQHGEMVTDSSAVVRKAGLQPVAAGTQRPPAERAGKA